MATTSTRAEFINAVLDALGVLIPGQAPTDEIVARVDQHLDKVFARLAAAGIYYVQDPGTPTPPTGGAIDHSVFLDLADCTAWAVASAFNLVGDPALKVLNDEAEKSLRQLGRPARTRKTLRTDIQLRAGRYRGIGFNFSTGT